MNGHNCWTSGCMPGVGPNARTVHLGDPLAHDDDTDPVATWREAAMRARDTAPDDAIPVTHTCGHDGCTGPTTDHHVHVNGRRLCSCICAGCGNPEVEVCYENFAGVLLCCTCAECCEPAETGRSGAFWADLEEDMKDPEFRKFYEQARRKMQKERDATGILATGKRWARDAWDRIVDLYYIWTR